MPRLSNSIVISGRRGPVYDLATSARFWLRWHPATEGVGGVVERPLREGDIVAERGHSLGVPFQTIWTVTERIPDTRIVMRADSAPITLTYLFEAEADRVTMTRHLDYDPAGIPPSIPRDRFEQTMSAESQKALDQLETLIAEILRRETEPLA